MSGFYMQKLEKIVNCCLLIDGCNQVCEYIHIYERGPLIVKIVCKRGDCPAVYSFAQSGHADFFSQTMLC